MAVAKSDAGTAIVALNAASTINLTTYTVNPGSTLLLASVAIGGVPGTVVATWDSTGTNQAMTQVATIGGSVKLYLFMLINPVSGNKTLSVSGLGAHNTMLGAVAFSGTDVVNGIVAADTLSITGVAAAPITIGPINSTVDGATVAVTSQFGTSNGLATTSQIQAYLLATFLGHACSYALGGTANTHTWSVTVTGAWAAIGVHVIAAAAAGHGPGGHGRQSMGGVHSMGVFSGPAILLNASMGVM